MTARRVLAEIGMYGGLCLLVLALLFRTLGLGPGDLRVPLGYLGGDTLSVAMAFKGILENGWYLRNPSVGAPFGLELHDYPTSDALNFVWVKVLGFLVPDWATVLNLLFLLGFPAVAATAFAAMRALGLRVATAGAMAILYAFLPYHFWRGESHIFLGFYYLVPVLSYLAIRLWDPHPPFFAEGTAARRREAVWVTAACLAAGASGIYYAYFGCFFFVVAALSSCLRDRDGKAIRSAALLIALVVAGVAANLAPTWAYHRAHGKNPTAVVRQVHEAEVWALKLAQLVVPVDGHRIPAFAALKARYNEFPLPNENTAMLGLAGSIGFVWLLVRRLRVGGSSGELIDRLSVLNLGAILLATVGSLSGLLALIADLGIRSYNRISVFIAFFALLAAGLLLDRLRAGFGTAPLPRLGGIALAGLVAALGFLDQVPPAFKPQIAEARAAWASDRELVQAIEKVLPAGAMVYQVPYFPFPEHPSIHELPDYDLFRGYLQSRSLRWSYGAMKGRSGDLWHRHLAEHPLDERLASAVAAGFQAVVVARKGFPDRGAAIERELADLAGAPPLVSRDETLAFFDLRPHAASLRRKLGAAGWRSLVARSRSVVPLWTDGCYDLEGGPTDNWRWCGPEGALRLHNVSDRAWRVRLSGRVASGFAAPARFEVTGPGFADSRQITDNPVRYERTLAVPPGDTIVRFRSEAPLIHAPADSRRLVFRFLNASISVSP
ncbi:MAG: hypothetical protein FJZ01_20785 [Candidatus Sericytochromatia bacterium]|nr:hypothetical protein [Candidatus Tanganyikabacteria bacterium]